MTRQLGFVSRSDCPRCGGLGREPWRGRIVSRKQNHIGNGPCLACRPGAFWPAYEAQDDRVRFAAITFGVTIKQRAS